MVLVCALAKAGIHRPVKFSGRRTMTSISWAFEIVAKSTEYGPVFLRDLRGHNHARSVAQRPRFLR